MQKLKRIFLSTLMCASCAVVGSDIDTMPHEKSTVEDGILYINEKNTLIPEEFDAAILQFLFTREECASHFRESSQELKESALTTIQYFMQNLPHEDAKESLRKNWLLGYLDSLNHGDEESLEIFDLGAIHGWKEDFQQRYIDGYLEAIKDHNKKDLEIFRAGLAQGVVYVPPLFLALSVYPEEVEFLYFHSNVQSLILLRSLTLEAIRCFYTDVFHEHKNELVKLATQARKNWFLLSTFKEALDHEKLQFLEEEKELFNELKSIISPALDLVTHINNSVATLLFANAGDLNVVIRKRINFIDSFLVKNNQDQDLKFLIYTSLMSRIISDSYEKMPVVEKIAALGGEYALEEEQFYLDILFNRFGNDGFLNDNAIINGAKILIERESNLHAVTEQLFSRYEYCDKSIGLEAIKILIGLKNKKLAAQFCLRIISKSTSAYYKIDAIKTLLQMNTYVSQTIDAALKSMDHSRYQENSRDDIFNAVAESADQAQMAEFCLKVLLDANLPAYLKLKAVKALLKMEMHTTEALDFCLEIAQKGIGDDAFNAFDILMGIQDQAIDTCLKIARNIDATHSIRIKAVKSLLEMEMHTAEALDICLEIVQEAIGDDAFEAFNILTGIPEQDQVIEIFLKISRNVDARDFIRMKAAETLIVKFEKHVPEAAQILIELSRGMRFYSTWMPELLIKFGFGEIYKDDLIVILQNVIDRAYSEICAERAARRASIKYGVCSTKSDNKELKEKRQKASAILGTLIPLSEEKLKFGDESEDEGATGFSAAQW